MSNRLISIIIGSLLVLGTGAQVYTAKQASLNPPENPSFSGGTSAGSESINTGGSWFGEREDEGDDDGGSVGTPTPAPSTKPTGGTTGGITLAQIASHNSRSSCWSAINGSVYDLTGWIPNHPGGEQNILILCGKDGSAAYNNQHGGNSRTASILAGFKIGTLK